MTCLIGPDAPVTVVDRAALTSLDSPVPRQAAVRLHARHKDGQLPALAAPAAGDSHAQGLMGFFLHCDVFLLTGHTLGQILPINPQRQLTAKDSYFHQ